MLLVPFFEPEVRNTDSRLGYTNFGFRALGERWFLSNRVSADRAPVDGAGPMRDRGADRVARRSNMRRAGIAIVAIGLCAAALDTGPAAAQSTRGDDAVPTRHVQVRRTPT